jgi:hypothetical protein
VTLLRTLLALIAWIGLPGLAVGALACRRGHEGDTSERFLGVALVAGLSVWLLGSELLVQADALREGPVVLIGVALAVVSLILLAGPGRAGIKVVLGANERVTLIVAPLIALLGGLPLLGQLVSNRDSFAQPTPWYYWQQVRDTVSAHGVPAWSYEWARRITFLDDYGAFTAGTGVLVVAARAVRRDSRRRRASGAHHRRGHRAFLLARCGQAARTAAAVPSWCSSPSTSTSRSSAPSDPRRRPTCWRSSPRSLPGAGSSNDGPAIWSRPASRC